ncbi:CYTH domain-containing protein [Mitsuaria sp. WAJ17]|uniref:CYTH domain-containing protein n=1 Tax=Mitsuaria sp. WAJ17 TaxID=2761452 RepID=UPI0016005726|nr:CYTH domain-containing protein [Mitsuaria sp. WAJ17]MBB2488001.1 CYTH domain-containing protein [Mitsuaria sp. WAJ17]
MGVEIERKFLVRGEGWRQGEGRYLCQAYLSRDPARTVRVRIDGQQAFLTIKGLTAGATRAEFEYAIPVADAKALLALADGPCIEKFRHCLPAGGLIWEIDEFLGANAPLVVAEIELPSEDHPFDRPDWLGEEVTQDTRYFNSALAARPYSSWQASSG